MLVVPSKIEALMALAADSKNNIFIQDTHKVTEKLSKLDADGVELLHIITDFDMTLTQYWHDGARSMSTHGVLENAPRMTDECRAALNDLYKTYYPIEVSPIIPFEEKVEKMKIWWSSAHKIIANIGLTEQDIQDMVRTSPVTFRPLLREFIEICHSRDLPVLIFSAGLTDVLTEILTSSQLIRDNMDIVSNKMHFENGVVVSFEDPLIHTFNKNEAAVVNTKHYVKIENRPNVSQVKLTIGFLNHDHDLLIDQYAEAFDIVVLQDSTLSFVIQLLKSLS
ncbi:hypothetical protein BASA60_007345 [Batrachochytrium salamandrivorans]|nr:hypothetical protein BASA60_007345 [Batrachochytrium salamandrivorans]KAH6571217.1 hypothetical protein BASA62_003988 [Batrachochytrium salamandrivorans]